MENDNWVEPLASELAEINGVKAVVLGGSRARGTAITHSDYDLGLYYHPDQPLDIAALGRLAAQLDDRHSPDLVTQPGGWGPWINGGGWLKINGRPVDLIYRDLARVEESILDCRSGKIGIHYQPGHPFGFLTSIYAAEIALCRVLSDPVGEVARLKALVTPYPAALKEGFVRQFGWEMRFSLEIAGKAVDRADLMHACGCLYRCSACMNLVLFALNETHWMNEKGALRICDGFKLRPENFRLRVEEGLTKLTAQPEAIRSSLVVFLELVNEMELIISRNN